MSYPRPLSPCPDLARRQAQLSERMEQAQGPETVYRRTLRRFALINRLFSRYRILLKRWVISEMKRQPDRDYTLVDMGAGGCDIDRWLAQRASRAGLRLRIVAVDHDPRALDFCRSNTQDLPDIQVRQEDALDVTEREAADFVFANHLLHHMTDDEVVRLLQNLDRMPLIRYVLSDLRRSCFAWRGFRLTAWPFGAGSYIVEDGLASIRRAFSINELRGLIARARLRRPIEVRAMFPSRLVVVGGRLLTDRTD